MKQNLNDDVMPTNKDVVIFKPNYDLVCHVTNNFMQLEDNSKMRSCVGYELLEHRGTVAAAKHPKHANDHLDTFKEGIKSAMLSNKKCTNMPCADADALDNNNQGFYIKN